MHQNSRGQIEQDSFPTSAPTQGDPQLVQTLCIMISLLAGVCHQVKACHSVQPHKHSAWLAVPTTVEPIERPLSVLAAGTDWDRTKEAMVDETLSSLFPIPIVLPSPDVLQEPSDQGPAAQLRVSSYLTKMIAVFAEDWLDFGDQELSGVRDIDGRKRISNPVSAMRVPCGLIHLMSSWVAAGTHSTTGVWSLVP